VTVAFFPVGEIAMATIVNNARAEKALAGPVCGWPPTTPPRALSIANQATELYRYHYRREHRN